MFWLLQLRLGGEERSPLTFLAVLKSKDDCCKSSFLPSFHGSCVRTDGQIGATSWSFSGVRRGTGKCLTRVKLFIAIKKEKSFKKHLGPACCGRWCVVSGMWKMGVLGEGEKAAGSHR